MLRKISTNYTFVVPEEEDDYIDTIFVHKPTTDFTEPEPYTCYTLSQSDHDEIRDVDFWLNGIFGLPLAFGGVINNVIFILVLMRPWMRRSTFNQLLIVFASINILSLLGRIIHVLEKTFHVTSDAYTLMFPHFLYPTRYVMLAATVFITIAVVHERWKVVTNPNYEGSVRKLFLYIAIVAILAISINIPRFFEMRRVPTILGIHLLRPTSLRTDPYYSIFYICWARLIFLKVIPNLVLLFLCYKMYKAIRVGPSETSSFQTTSDFNMDQERKMAAIFLAIVVAFFICHLPANFLNIHEAITVNNLIYCLERKQNGLPPSILCLRDVSNFFLYTYPCINLLFVFVPKFGYRNQFVAFILCRPWQQKHSNRFDRESPRLEDEADIMDHELSEFDYPTGRRAFK